MSEDTSKKLAIKAIKSSVQRDSASGDGIDIMTITKKGIEQESMNL
jgi:proteasome beta subunit